jgi:TatD DNase family protein
MDIFETHAHLTDDRFTEDLDLVLNRAKAAGVNRLVLASADMEESEKSVRLASRRTAEQPEIWCMVGVHPHAASQFTHESSNVLANWLHDRNRNRIVGIGEIGLDYHYDLSPRDVQRDVFRTQLRMAYEEDVPFVLHEREATHDTLSILDEFSREGCLRKTPGVCHCFSGSEETAEVLLRLGFFLGFDGPITFKNAKRAPQVIQMTPIDRLLVETDCPYLTPEPFRGKRNEPSYLTYIIGKMAEFKAVSVEEMARITTENARRLFEV